MQPHDRTQRWRAWVLAGSLALTVGVQAVQPVLAKPGFGQDSGDQRDRERRAEERRQQERAEQERRAEERRQQESKREAERQAERDRQAQERARREQHEAERRAQREREQAQETERRARRDAEERAARERQAERSRQLREAEQAARAERARRVQEADQAARAQREQEQQARQRAAEEREARERQVREAEQAARAERERARETQTERRRPGFGIKEEELRAERDRREAERLRRENTEAVRRAERERQAEQNRVEQAQQLQIERDRRERERRLQIERARQEREQQLQQERDRAHREAEHRAEPGVDRSTRDPRDDRNAESERRRDEAIRAGRIKDWGDGPGFGIKDPHRATRQGSLDRYFNPRGGDFSYRPDRATGRDRDRDRQRNRAYRDERDRRERYDRNRHDHDRYYRDRYHRDRYGRRYDRYDDGLYDIIYIPVPGPVIVHERVDTEIVRIPEPVEIPVPAVPETAPEPLRPAEPEIAAGPVSPSERLARLATLEELLDDIEQAWITENLALLMQYVRRDADLEIYRDGKFGTAMRRDEFETRTAEAFRRYDTVTLQFAAPRLLSATEAVAAAEHRYRAAGGGRERRDRIVYAFLKVGDAWWIAGIDTVRLEREGTLPQARPAVARTASPPVLLSRVSVLSAPRLRGVTLRAQSRPMRVATLRAIVNGRAGLFDLKAMRGLRPDTLAWGLYRRGQSRPLETGTVMTGRLRATPWLSVGLLRRTPHVRSVRAVVTPVLPAGTVVFPIRALAADTALTLGPTSAPRKGKTAR